MGAVKIYVVRVEALRKTERGGQNRMKLSLQFGTKSGAALSLTPPPLKANVLFCIFFESHPVLDQTQGTGAVFSSLYRKL
jgi:hypothetical protein